MPTCSVYISDLTLKKFNQKSKTIVQKVYLKYVSKKMRLSVTILEILKICQ